MTPRARAKLQADRPEPLLLPGERRRVGDVAGMAARAAQSAFDALLVVALVVFASVLALVLLRAQRRDAALLDSPLEACVEREQALEDARGGHVPLPQLYVRCQRAQRSSEGP